MKVQSCPANNPNCNAQLYSSGDFVFCPKCKLPNPNYTRVTTPEKRAPNSLKQQPIIDIASGVIQWK